MPAESYFRISPHRLFTSATSITWSLSFCYALNAFDLHRLFVNSPFMSVFLCLHLLNFSANSDISTSFYRMFIKGSPCIFAISRSEYSRGQKLVRMNHVCTERGTVAGSDQRLLTRHWKEEGLSAPRQCNASTSASYLGTCASELRHSFRLL